MKPEHIEDVLVHLHSGQWFGWLETELKSQQDAYDNDYARKRQEEYPSIDELVVALWEGVVEERMAAVTSLEGKRQAVKTKYPK